jgi:hypothetical protein
MSKRAKYTIIVATTSVKREAKAVPVLRLSEGTFCFDAMDDFKSDRRVRKGRRRSK